MEGWVIVLLSVRQCLLGCLILKVGGQVVLTGYYWRTKHWWGAARRCRTPGWDVSPADTGQLCRQSHSGSLVEKQSFPKSDTPFSSSSAAKDAAAWTLAHRSKKKRRTDLCRDTLQCSAQLEAVAMAFLSCWLRISRVRDSRSRSWQVLQTSTGS